MAWALIIFVTYNNRTQKRFIHSESAKYTRDRRVAGAPAEAFWLPFISAIAATNHSAYLERRRFGRADAHGRRQINLLPVAFSND